MLNVIGGGTSVDQSTLPDWVSIYAQSGLHKENAARLQRLSRPKGQVPAFDTPYARSFAVQFKEIIKRLGRLYCQKKKKKKKKTRHMHEREFSVRQLACSPVPVSFSPAVCCSSSGLSCAALFRRLPDQSATCSTARCAWWR